MNYDTELITSHLNHLSPLRENVIYIVTFTVTELCQSDIVWQSDILCHV
jgi:hypothetical protein